MTGQRTYRPAAPTPQALVAYTAYGFVVVAGFLTVEHHGGQAAAWPTHVATAALFTVLWPGQASWYGRDDSPQTRTTNPTSTLLGISALAWLIVLIAGLICGHDPVEVARVASWNVFGVLALLLAYRVWRAEPGWFPHTPADVCVFTGLVFVSSIPAVLGGAMPGVAAWLPASTADLAWWGTVWMLPLEYGGLLGFVLLSPVETYTTVRFPTWQPVALVGSVICIHLAMSFPELPLSWLMLLPALWVGVTMTPRIACIALVMIGALLGGLSQPQGSSLEEAVRFLVLSVTAMAIAMLGVSLVMFRERHAHTQTQGLAATRQAAAQSAILDVVVSSMTDGVLLTDRHGRVVSSNPAARALLGAPRHGVDASAGWVRRYDVRGSHGTDLNDAQITALEQPPLQRAPSTDHGDLTLAPDGSALDAEVATADGAGGWRTLAVHTRALTRTPQSLDAHQVVLLKDVTASRQRRQELETFAGVVAHDLRNPLGAVSLWLESAAMDVDDGDPAAAREPLARARQAGRRMRQVIDDYLAYTVGREGVLRVEELDLGAVIREVAAVNLRGPRGPRVDVLADAWVQADRTLLRQLFANLIGNAVKYARDGEDPYVRIRAVHDDPAGWVRIYVEDKGIGLDAKDAETVFAPFGRTSHGTAMREGTGLGLALCRTIVTRHHGQITAYRNAWGGATVELTLPQGRAMSD
ncbi:Adaptive-response sensory-kinase SasA [Austwickia sp. TVS 96-490-7B]|uniref:sensor histidine kinase n=1 Tax=Austwickia sp. TVS 96-490-7B TaxID=2830843 RepID=UPI001C57C443|nr:sensor histidine kinase [Austwickia sp. TVS 96-490-7B]MBW3085144.1 Adaptive-response sensory-kinase SasA [Austwickia sp. TVS 96-490-7B]